MMRPDQTPAVTRLSAGQSSRRTRRLLAGLAAFAAALLAGCGTSNNASGSTKQAPVITWTAPAGITYGTALSAVQLDATANTPGTFTYTPALGIVLTAGTQTLSVSFVPLDSADFGSASATTTVAVAQAVPMVSWPTPAPIGANTPLSAAQLDATSFTPGTFTYTPPAGTVEPVGTDTLSVKFQPTDVVDYATVTASVQLVVQQIQTAPTVTWPTPAGITYGTTLSGAQLDATASVPGAFVYTPAAGTVPTAGTDTLSVTFTPTDTVHYTNVTATVALAVAKATPTITYAAPAPVTYGTALGSAQLDATASAPGSISYMPPAGTVPQAGNTTITAAFTPNDTADYNTASASAVLKVNQVTPTISWATPAPVATGTALSSAQLNATASVPGTFVYNPALGSVPPAGTDTLNVTFTPTDAVDYTTATASVLLKVVTATAPSITWTPPTAIVYGTALSSAQLNATASVPGSFVYTPAAGTLLAAGNTTLSAVFTPTDTLDYSTVTTTVPLTVSKANAVITWPTPVSISQGTALSSIQLDATSNIPGTLVYTPPAGTILPLGSNTLSVAFTPTDSTDYNNGTASVVLQVVNKQAPVVTWATPASIVYGTALSGTQLNATASVAGTFAYTPAAGSIPAAGTDTLSATFTPNDTVNYTSVTKVVSLVVTKANPTLTWATPAPITYGTALSSVQLNATASVPGTFTYTPTAGVLEPTGTDTLSVTFTPTDAADYNSAAASTTLTVNKATPTITWATPAPIVYGTALSATQLNATANTPGTFTYTPTSGTVETAGTNTLSVTFTPADTNDYTSTATASVILTVTQATPTLTWASPASINSMTPLSSTQLNATANVPGTFVYTPAAGTLEPVGTDTLSVAFTPTDSKDYTTATATVSLVVTSSQKAPTVTWNTPTPIPFGYPLNATQLNATASVPGTFAYTPGPGTIEPAGNDTLQVTFTPTDNVTYSTVTTSVQLVVTPAPAALNTLYFIQQMVNLDALAEFPAGTTTGETDSKDTRAYGPGATYFYGDVDGGNFHGEVTINGVAQHIMMTATGPGVVTRLFTGGPGFGGHNIRYYIDGSTTPAIQADLNSLLTCATAYATAPLCYMSGEPYPFPVLPQGAPSGQNLYLPVPFAKSIMITYDGPENAQPLMPGSSSMPYPVLDYVFEYKLLPAGTNVQSYTLTDYQNSSTAIQNALALLPPINQVGASPAPGPFADPFAVSIYNKSVPAGGSANITLPAGSNAIRYLQTNIGSSAATLAGVTLSMTFDGEQTVNNVPFGDFFGAGNGTKFGGGTGASSNIGVNAGTTMSQSVTSDGNLVSRWTMPYQASASITITNNTTAAVTVPLNADINPYAFDFNTMHFHAFERINGSTTTTNNQTTRLLFANGTGIYVGDNETLYTYQNDNAFNFWGEGDEMFYVDTDVTTAAYPSHRGTGTEDYYGYAYGNPALFQTPWASNVADPVQTPNEGAGMYNGTTVLNRTRLLDTIPFNTHLRFDFEIDDHDQNEPANDISSYDGYNHLVIDHTAFFYALPGLTLSPDSLTSGQNYTIQSKIAGWNIDSKGGNLHTDILGIDQNQIFTLTSNGAGLWTIKDVATGMYVGVAGNTSNAGTPLSLGAATGQCGQLWSIADSGLNNDYSVITNSCDGQVVDLYYALQVPGTTVQQYYQNGSDAQFWRFNLVPAK